MKQDDNTPDDNTPDEVVMDTPAESVASELARPEDLLPVIIPLLPIAQRPFFPGQVMPVVLNAGKWGDTIKQVHESAQGAVGLVYTGGVDPDEVQPGDFRSLGTVCKVHQVQQHEDQLHVILAGLQRFRIEEWLSTKQPYAARVTYYPETEATETTEIKAYTTAIINVIKELLPLNPLYGEELKMFISHFGPNEPSRLADFGASLTTAAADEMQDILETIDLSPRLEKALVLLQKELEVARAQMEIRKHVEGEMQERQREAFLREQLNFIQKELGITKDDKTADIDLFKKRLEKLTLPTGAEERVSDELD
ncbi:MAG: LON peptidase substrate-binding domain-containing protein, partial [Pseudomonadota bacterium]|nr:LON peptidase substrate-binding domain-containing protein [Pseudomonadota bacterium]